MGEREPKRLRFSADDDLALLRETVSENPLLNPEKWEIIQKNLFEITGKKFSIRTIKDHLQLILEVWLKKDSDSQKKSGIEEIYSERDHLLQEISDICNSIKDMGNTGINTPKRRKVVSKEKQILELGKQRREQYARQFKIDDKSLNLTDEPSTSTNNLTDIIDHNYFQYCSPDTEEVSGEVVIGETEVGNLAVSPVNIEIELNDENVDLEKVMKKVEIQKKTSEPNRKILGPRKTKTNRSSAIRKNALEYLKNKEDKDRIIKMKELELEERRLKLEENRWEWEVKEKKDRLEMDKERFYLEKERIQQELQDRNHLTRIMEQQQNLIQSLLMQLQRYEER